MTREERRANTILIALDGMLRQKMVEFQLSVQVVQPVDHSPAAPALQAISNQDRSMCRNTTLRREGVRCQSRPVYRISNIRASRLRMSRQQLHNRKAS